MADTADTAIQINQQGESYFQDGEMDQAISCFEKAISIDPGYAEAYNNLACAYMQGNDYPTALEYITKAYELDQNSQAIVLNTGSILAKLGSMDDALLVFRSYLDNNPGDAVVAEKLNEIEQAQNHSQSKND